MHKYIQRAFKIAFGSFDLWSKSDFDKEINVWVVEKKLYETSWDWIEKENWGKKTEITRKAR